MADISPSKMKNKISFYREVSTVNANGEKTKQLTILKQNVSAEFKYIGTPSAGASEEQIQEQRTGKIKAEIRCRYIKNIKFEDLVYFEGGKFRIYSIQYEGRHKAIKLRAELRDDDTYFGLPSDDYDFLPPYNATGIEHTRTNAPYKVIENVPFPKTEGTNYLFENPAGLPVSVAIANGSTEPSSSAEFNSIAERFPWKVSTPEQIPGSPFGRIRSYTTAWYHLWPNNQYFYSRLEVDGKVLLETSPGPAEQGGQEYRGPMVAAGVDNSGVTSINNKTYRFNPTGLLKTDPETNLLVDAPQYGIPYGVNHSWLYYRLTPMNLVNTYSETLNARDKENAVNRTASSIVYCEDRIPVQVLNRSLSFPTDITADMFRQAGQMNRRVDITSSAPLLSSNSKEKPKTGNLRITDGPEGLRIETINTVTITKPNGEGITSLTFVTPVEEVEEGETPPDPVDDVIVELSTYFTPLGLLDSEGEISPLATGIAYPETLIGEGPETQVLDLVSAILAQDATFPSEGGTNEKPNEWKGGKITFNVTYSPNPTTELFNENAAYAVGQDLTYHIV
tara:strand:- start:342 stop:2030 length:1689 start_codon:yes stop_codon:yes gene_type:complete